MTKQERYQQYKDLGICPQCKSPWIGKQVMCDSCRAAAEENRRKRRMNRLKAGLCTRCGKHKMIPGTKYCEECAKKARKHKDSQETKEKRLQKYHKVYKKILSDRRKEYKAAGLCADCGKVQAEIGVVCKECYSKRREVYEKEKLRSLGGCNGDCVNCMLPWCIDNGDEENYSIKLTTQEKQLSRQLDREATEDERRWKVRDRMDKKNIRQRLDYAMAIIADIESRRELGEVITDREEKKLQKAEERVRELKKQL